VPCSGSYGKSGGIDWHNLGIVFPTESLEPHHPWVTSSLTRWRHSYVEGLIPYPRQGEFWMLHNYNTINLSEAWLRRGDQEEALRDLYGVLLHTTATHAASEVVDSSGRRDLSSTPHNWFSAKLVRFVRDMLVYEGHDGRLHLLGCLSPAWMVPGMRVAISDAPTEFGSVCLESTMIKGGMDVTIQFRGEKRPGGAILHVPPFASGVTADCGGRMLPTTADGIELPLASKIDVRVRWSDSVLPDVSFERVAASFVRDYEVRRSRL